MKRKAKTARHEQVVRARASSKKLTNAEAAAKLRKVAEAYYKRNQKLFAGDRHGLDVIENDYYDLRYIASSIRAGDLSGAYRQACRFDTLVRDEIPLDVWMYIGGSGLHE